MSERDEHIKTLARELDVSPERIEQGLATLAARGLIRERSAGDGVTGSTASSPSVWAKPEYEAADAAYAEALSTDPNDRMTALSLAVDAALTTASPHKRYITIWRRTDRVLDWDSHVSEDIDETRQVITNLKKQGVHQYRTFPIGDAIPELSSAY